MAVETVVPEFIVVYHVKTATTEYTIPAISLDAINYEAAEEQVKLFIAAHLNKSVWVGKAFLPNTSIITRYFISPKVTTATSAMFETVLRLDRWDGKPFHQPTVELASSILPEAEYDKFLVFLHDFNPEDTSEVLAAGY